MRNYILMIFIIVTLIILIITICQLNAPESFNSDKTVFLQKNVTEMA